MSVTHLFVSALPDGADATLVRPSNWNEAHVVSIDNADVAAGAGIVESKLSLNFPTHAAVTLGTASGLSLVGQVLSLGLASSGVTGALSGTDWDTFNGKQSALSFPLSPSLGGTGINNGTNTLTVPATGTAALLATANTFTVPQTIDLAADGIGLTIQGAAAQASNLLVLEASGGTDLLSVDATGRITQVATSTDHTDSTHNSFSTDLTFGTNPSISQVFGTDYFLNITNTVAVSRQLFGARFQTTVAIGSTASWTGTATVIGGYFRAQVASSSSISVPNAIGGDFFVATPSNRASWIATKAMAGRFGLDLQSNATHTTAGAYGLYLLTHTKNANITITNDYGLYIEDINQGGTLNYAIYTNAGLNRFGDQLSIDGSADRNQLIVTGYTTQTNPVAHLIDNTATTNAVRNVLQLEARSSGTAAAGFGPGLPMYAETATGGTYQQQGLISTSWIDSTNATRKAKLSLSAHDTAERLGIEIHADGTRSLVGIGGVTPTARLHLPAGGTAANTAPLKFTTQANPLTSVEQGAMELVGNSLQFTQLAKRRGVVMSQGTRTADFQLVSSASESAAIITAEHGANYLEVGKTEEIILRGTIQKDVGAPTNTLTIRTKYAGATIHTIVSSNNAIAANTTIEIVIVATCRSTGATGTLQINSIVRIDGDVIAPAAPTLVTIDTTTAQNTTVTAQFTNASATNNLVIHQGRVLCIEPNK